MRAAKRSRQFGHFGKGLSVQLFFEMLDSQACLALSGTEYRVLSEMMRKFQKLSGWDTRRLDEGMTFTWNDCPFVIAERTFRDAVGRIMSLGFFELDPQYEGGGLCSARRFVPSRKWTKYKMKSDERKEFDSHFRRKRTRIQGKRRRRANLLAKRKICNHPRGALRTHPKGAVPKPCNHPKSAVFDGEKGDLQPPKGCRFDQSPCTPRKLNEGGNAPEPLITSIAETALTLLTLVAPSSTGRFAANE